MTMPQNPNAKLENGKRWRYLVPFLILLLFLALFAGGLFPRLGRWREIETLARQNDPIKVSTMTLTPLRQPIELVLPSTTQAMHITPLWARTNGYLTNYLVDIGDKTKEGQLLAEIDTPEVDRELLQARADLESAKAKLNIASISAKRWTDLYQLNAQAVPHQEVDERMSTLHSAEGDVKAAEANVQRLEKIQGFNRIYAPFDGTIIERNIDVGSLITAGSNGNPQQLFKIAQVDPLRVFVNVPQFYYRTIKDGLETKIKVKEFPHQSFKGVVVRNAGALDPVARTLSTEIYIDNRDGQLVPGLYAEVIFSLVPEESYFVVPTKALIIRNQAPQAAILDKDNRIKLVDVVIGRDYGKSIEIVSGLNENERLVINPSPNIVEGVEVDPSSHY